MSLSKVLLFAALFASPSLLLAQNDKSAPEVAPGIVLPSTGTIYSLDVFEHGPHLVQIHPTEITHNTHAGSNFARSMVYSGPHTSIDLTGVSSAATFHTSQLVLYVRLSGDDPELQRNRVKLLHLHQVKGRRIVSDFSTNIFGGQRSRRFDELATAKSDIAGTTWIKLVPQAPLEPGEYGIVFMPKDTNLFAEAVYDFSIAGDPPQHQKR